MDKYVIEQAEEEIKKYPPHIQKIRHTMGFIEQYWLMLADYTDKEDAYSATERMHKQWYEENKYKDYESFRVSMSNHLKKRAKENENNS